MCTQWQKHSSVIVKQAKFNIESTTRYTPMFFMFSTHIRLTVAEHRILIVLTELFRINFICCLLMIFVWMAIELKHTQEWLSSLIFTKFSFSFMNSCRPLCVPHRMRKILESLSAVSRLFCISRNHFCAADARQINDQMESRHCPVYLNFRRAPDKRRMHVAKRTLNFMLPADTWKIWQSLSIK